MANILSTQPVVDATNVAANAAANKPSFRITPETYTTIDSLIKTTKDHVLPDLVETYGDQGITGFLKLTGAINAGGTSDQFDWWELGRRHSKLAYTSGHTTINGSGETVTINSASDVASNVQANDVLMDAASGARFIVKSGGSGSGSAADVVLVKLDDSAAVAADIDASSGGTLIKLGNMYAQGTNQPTAYDDIGVRKYSNSYMIV